MTQEDEDTLIKFVGRPLALTIGSLYGGILFAALFTQFASQSIIDLVAAISFVIGAEATIAIVQYSSERPVLKPVAYTLLFGIVAGVIGLVLLSSYLNPCATFVGFYCLGEALCLALFSDKL